MAASKESPTPKRIGSQTPSVTQLMNAVRSYHSTHSNEEILNLIAKNPAPQLQQHAKKLERELAAQLGHYDALCRHNEELVAAHTQELAALSHDMERAMANHNADLSAPSATRDRVTDRCLGLAIEALRKLGESKAMNAWGHMTVTDALAAIGRVEMSRSDGENAK